MNSFVPVPSSPGCAARHYVIRFAKYRGKMLGQLPGWYLRFLLTRTTLDPDLRLLLYETLVESADRRYALEQVMTTALAKLESH